MEVEERLPANLSHRLELEALPLHPPPPGWEREMWVAGFTPFNHTLSPDGTRLAFLGNQGDHSNLFCLPLEKAARQALTLQRPPQPLWLEDQPAWAPDGSGLALSSGGQLSFFPVDGSAPRLLAAGRKNVRMPRWFADGSALLVCMEVDGWDCVARLNPATGEARILTLPGGDARDPQPAPNGLSAVCTFRPGDDLLCSRLDLLDLEDGSRCTLTYLAETRDFSPRWSPDGGRIAFLSNRTGFNEIWILDMEEGEPYPLTYARLDFTDIAWSPDGKRLAACLNREGAWDLALVDAGDGALSVLRMSDGVHARPQWSPDGSFLTVEYQDARTPPGIYRLDPAQKPAHLQNLLPEAAAPRPPAESLVQPERVTYPSFDGLHVPGLLYRPARPNGAALLFLHGGPRAQFVYDWQPFLQYLAACGYAILCPNYRGSSGYGLEYELLNENYWGIGDVRDCLHAARWLAQQGWDPARLGIFGVSFGGYLTACALARDPEARFACGVSLYGYADLHLLWRTCMRETRLIIESQIGDPHNNPQVYEDGSPLGEFASIHRPLLLLHGQEDAIVPPVCSLQMARQLERLERVYASRAWEGEGHGFMLPASVLDVNQCIERFFDAFLS